MKFMGGHALLVVSLAEGRLLAGDTAEAAVLARRALELARAQHERGYEAWTLRLLGEIALRDAEGGEGERWWPAAMTLAADLGMRPLVAHCHRGLAELSRRRGNAAEAARHAAAAAAAFAGMGMISEGPRAPCA